MDIYYRIPMPTGNQLEALKDLPITPLSDSTLTPEWSALCIIPNVWCVDFQRDVSKDGVPRFSGSALNVQNASSVTYITLPFELFLELCQLAVITDYFLAVELLRNKLFDFH